MDQIVRPLLAYVFWHRAGRAAGYEDTLVAFHQELARASLPFLVASAAYRVRGAPWMEDGGGYEDWYVVRDYADLGLLKEAAIAGRPGTAHDRAAGLATWGAAGLYAVLRGQPPLDADRVTWFGKPPDAGYPAFLSSLAETAWLVQRQLTLGPTPEFCAPGEREGGVVVRREAVHPPAPR